MENFPGQGKQMPIQIKEAFRTPNRQLKSSSPHHIIEKKLNIKNKENILKEEKVRQQISNKVRPQRITPHCSTEILEGRKVYTNVFQVLKDNTSNPDYHPQQICLS